MTAPIVMAKNLKWKLGDYREIYEKVRDIALLEKPTQSCDITKSD